MKKMIQFFNKKKKLTVDITSDYKTGDITSDAVPELPRDVPSYISKSSELYMNLRLDDSSNKAKSHERNHVLNSNGFKVSRGTLHAKGPEEITADLNAERIPLDRTEDTGESSEGNSPNIIQTVPACSSVESVRERESLRLNSNVCNSLSLNDVDNSSEIGPASDLALPEISTAQELTNDLVTRKIGDKKNVGSTYVITINNSAHFHIGSQKTVNYPGAEDNTFKTKELQLTHIKSGQILPLTGSQIMDIKDKLSEEDLLQISLNIRDKWREFAKNLGVDESTIHELEDLNDKDYNLIVYEVLQQYLSRYPDTSVGFMINVLKKSNEVEAIRKLLERR